VDATVALLREQMRGELRARDVVVPCVLVERGTVRSHRQSVGRRI